MIRIRQASLDDIPYLNALMEDHKDKFYTDFETYDPQALIQTVRDGSILVFEKDQIAVGGVWFFNQLDDLWVTVYTVIDPQALLEIRRRGLFEQLLDRAFVIMDVGKFTCSIHEGQKGVLRYLKRVLKFKQAGFKKNHTRRNGRLMGVYEFELHREWWQKTRQKAASEGHSASPDENDLGRFPVGDHAGNQAFEDALGGTRGVG